MAQYVTTVRTPRSPVEVFEYLADLRNLAEWDPGVKSAEQVTGEGGGLDTEFDVVVEAPGGGPRLRYVTTAYDAPRSFTVRAESKLLTSLDIIDVTPDGEGSVVRYDAQLTLNGPLKVFDPGLRLVFGRIGDRANQGLIRALDGEQA
jgi:carbon monoxide dehydrogenase subunit G